MNIARIFLFIHMQIMNKGNGGCRYIDRLSIEGWIVRFRGKSRGKSRRTIRGNHGGSGLEEEEFRCGERYDR